jgi:DNA mismatch repair protein MutS
VAALAGVPSKVIKRARGRLRELEDAARRHSDRGATQLPLFPLEPPNPAVEALRSLEPDGLSPRQALEALYRLKGLAGKG